MNTQKTPNPKCSCCLCYWKPTETDIKSSGLLYKTCVKCRAIAKAYRDTNKEAINQQQRDYYERNMTTFNQKQREIYNQNKEKNRMTVRFLCL